jgi:hypothetical protein
VLEVFFFVSLSLNANAILQMQTSGAALHSFEERRGVAGFMHMGHVSFRETVRRQIDLLLSAS